MVGMYDSGVGGLSVLRRLWRCLPGWPVLYVGDTARAPYGARTPSELARFGAQIARFLRQRGARVLVVACNTSSAVALPEVAEAFQGPVVGMLEPAARAIAAWLLARGLDRVGVLATETTVRSGAYRAALVRAARGRLEVVQRACPGWVPLIEQGVLEGPQAREEVRRHLQPLLACGVQAVVLGCTHYPFWEGLLREEAAGRVALLDPAQAVAQEAARAALAVAGINGHAHGAQRCAPSHSMAPGQAGGYDMFFTSGDPSRFEQLVHRLVGAERARLGRGPSQVQKVQWEEPRTVFTVRQGDSGPQPWPPGDWRGLAVAVVGLGAENWPLVRFLCRQGARVVAGDRKSAGELGEVVEELRALGVELHLGPSYLECLEGVQVAFLTPGMPKHLPAIQEARRRGVRITGQADLFLRLCPAPVVAVTGSSGKTTTTTLIGRMLAQSGFRVWVGGNIGRPLIDRLEEIGPQDRVVLELSSFQLETCDVSPGGAVVTNITPNHLDVHPDMAAYVAAKERIVRFQGPEDFAVLNADDGIVSAMAGRTRAQVRWFSLAGDPGPGAWLEGRRLLARPGRGRLAGSVRELASRDDLRLRGDHNVANALAACAAALEAGASPEAIREVLRTFSGVPHRLEEVARVDGVLFVNDSIATSPARAVAALRSFSEPVVLIAGGYDKHLPFDEFARVAVERCRHVVLLGQTADAIAQALELARQQSRELSRGGGPPAGASGPTGPTVSRARSLEEAVAQAREAARPGDVVLLSPACASYDMFRNFEERGARFRELVRRLAEEAQPVGAS